MLVRVDDLRGALLVGVECMLATPPTAVKRIGTFVMDGHALNAINALDEHIARIQQDLDDGMHSLAKDPTSSGWSTTSCSSMTSR